MTSGWLAWLNDFVLLSLIGKICSKILIRIFLMEQKIKIGISSCLLGEKVRYDGGHKLDHYLNDTLGQFVTWVSVCPEVESGLSVPREAMHLVQGPESPRLVTIRSGIDYTDRMLSWAKNRLYELEHQDICGFIFKSRSPSSGMSSVKVYTAEGMPTSQKGIGIFAKAFMEHFTLIPVEDDGRLHDPKLRENFIERVFVYHRWKNFLKETPTIQGLIDFHTDHKLLIMAHSPNHLRTLGKLAANTSPQVQSIFDNYLKTLTEALSLIATVKKNVNVLQHMAGYFKKNLSSGEKQELSELILRYHQGLLPLIVPVTLINHYVSKYDEPYLKRQHYLNPHPFELMLRNHV
jgi:uncharacterized protein YbgA (DUF1722 family)/uncharacterized protein YbbK (DUF523 family)